MKAMILAAGIGSRLKPLTDKQPKALVKVGEYRMIDLSLAYLSKHGIDEFIVNAHHFADQMMEWVAEKRWQGYNIAISHEEDLLNTGGGLVKARPFFDGESDFVLIAVDVLTDLNLSDMIKKHQLGKNLVTLAVKKRETSRDLMFDDKNLLSGWKHNQTGEEKLVEGRDSSYGLGFSGVHVISTKLFPLIEEKGAFSIVDLYLRLASTQRIAAYNHSEGKWLEFGRAEKIPDLVKSDDFAELINKLNVSD